MKAVFWVRFLVVASLFSLACSGCEEEPKKEVPKKIEKVEKVEEPKVDPLKEAREAAERVAMDDSVYVSDRSREVVAEMEAAAAKRANRPKNPKTIKEPETGTLKKAQLRKVFNVHAGAMRKCYERQLKRNPNLQGKVKLQVLIRSNGTVGSAKAKGVSLQNGQVNNCMERQARTMKFPKPDGGAARVSMPYTFTPEI